MSYNENFVATTTSASTALERHVKFWDRKNKGYITPVDTVFGFINLGYGLIISVTLGTLLGVLFSYSTQDSWIPDVLCRTRTEKLQKGTMSDPYNSIGQLDQDLFDDLFSKHAKSDISGKTITIKELLEWNEATYKDPLTWSATALEWMALYILVGSKGVVKKEDIQAAYDGTLFYAVRDRNKQQRTIIQGAAADPSNNNNHNLNVSGVKVSKSYIHQVESKISNAVSVLPHNTVSLLETRLRHWLSFVQQQKQQTEPQGRSILKGVPTPVPTRRPLFATDANADVDVGASAGAGGLTGVLGVNLLDQAVTLTGVQNNEGHSGDADSDSDNGVEIAGLKNYSAIYDDGDGDTWDNNESSSGKKDLVFNMTGIRSEEDDGYNDNSQIDWLHTGQLTGVSPSTSVTTNLVSHEQENNMDQVDDFGKQPTTPDDGGGDLPNVSTPPLTETSSVTSDMDGVTEDVSEDTSKDQEENLNKINTTVNNSTSKKKNKKNKKKKNKQQQHAPTPPEKDDDIQGHEEKSLPMESSAPSFTGSPSSHYDDYDDDDLPASPSDTADQTKHNTASSGDNSLKSPFEYHHHTSWPSVAEMAPSDG